MRAVAVAPSKVILTGEHFVVHGSRALSVAVPVYTRAYTSSSGKLEILSRGFKRSELYPLYFIIRKISEEKRLSSNVRIEVDSQVPVGSGLGSSASSIVSCISSFLCYSGLELSKQELLHYSVEAEKKVHGNPSGIDPATCIYGSAIIFSKQDGIKTLPVRKETTFLVVNTGVRRSTRRLISNVNSRKEELSYIFSLLKDYVSKLSESASEFLVRKKLRELGLVLTANHAILSYIGVSSMQIDSIINKLIMAGCYGAKITGAGGGGCIISLPEEGRAKEIQEKIRGDGYDSYIARIPVEGVRAWQE